MSDRGIELKRKKDISFKMWLEFELWEEQDYDLEEEFFNMSVYVGGLFT